MAQDFELRWSATLSPHAADRQETMSKHQYQYEALQDSHTIRMLTLDPGQHDDPLTGTLQAIPIDSAGYYEVISYVWADPGPGNFRYEMKIRDGYEEGILMLRGGSIYAALHRLRHPDRPRRIWADQCCINQDDLVERSKQVPLMNRIFRDAAHVLVWLGLDTDHEAGLAFGLIRELDGALTNRSADDAPHSPDTVDLERHIKDNHKALQKLTDRAWVSSQIFQPSWWVRAIRR